MKIGARIIKSGIAVSITVLICQLLNLEPALFGAVSAVLNVQPSVYLTFRIARDQVAVHVLGVTVGLVLGYALGGNPATMGLATVLVIFLCLKLKLNQNILMGIVACLFVLSSSADQFLYHALSRSSVIFIGLTVALIINIAILPPRYGRLWTEKLRAGNEAAVDYFCQAVYNFTHLENQGLTSPEAMKQQVEQLNKETRHLAELFQRERINTDFNCLDDQQAWSKLAENLMEYNHTLTERANQIYELLPTRLERRLSHGEPQVSEEFKSILEVLASGCPTVRRVNEKLRVVVCDMMPVESEEISEAYWDKLTGAVEQWQPRLSGSYYLHALIEVAVVANEIKWATREAKKMTLNAGSCKLNPINPL
jgi:uncharacterized membrane protein YgaE (UPF0421/DUF939 family)